MNTETQKVDGMLTIRAYGKTYTGENAWAELRKDEIGVWMPVQRSRGCWVVERRTGMGGDDFETACHAKTGNRIYCETKQAAQKHADRLNYAGHALARIGGGA